MVIIRPPTHYGQHFEKTLLSWAPVPDHRLGRYCSRKPPQTPYAGHRDSDPSGKRAPESLRDPPVDVDLTSFFFFFGLGL